MSGPLSFGVYLKAAFRQRWNVLYLCAAGGVMAIFPSHAAAVLAFAGAGEAAILGALVGNGRFRRLVNSQTSAVENQRSSEQLAQRFNALYMGLSKDARERFELLKKRCEVLRGSSLSDDEITERSGIDKIEASQLQGVNRLLWVYLKLLHTHGALLNFLNNTDSGEIEALEKAARERLAEIPENAENPVDQKKRKSLEDTLASALSRRENLRHARENLEYVQLELARIASKVAALAEMTVARHDPDAITTEVDDAARSVETTEQAIGELRMFNGLTAEDVQAPRILNAPSVRVKG